MLPYTARPKDLVEVTNEDSEYYGMLGKIVSKAEMDGKETVTVVIYGKKVTLPREDLSMKARVGTSTYGRLVDEVEMGETRHIKAEDYGELIDYALSIGDFGWVAELSARRDEL